MLNIYSIDVPEIKKDLIKYCYLSKDTEFLKDSLVKLIQKCDNNFLIHHIFKMFCKYIYVYYTLDRTFFNKVRPYFMRWAMTLLIYNYQNEIHKEQLNRDWFLREYYYWCMDLDIDERENAYKEFKKLTEYKEDQS